MTLYATTEAAIGNASSGHVATRGIVCPEAVKRKPAVCVATIAVAMFSSSRTARALFCVSTAACATTLATETQDMADGPNSSNAAKSRTDNSGADARWVQN